LSRCCCVGISLYDYIVWNCGVDDLTRPRFLTLVFRYIYIIYYIILYRRSTASLPIPCMYIIYIYHIIYYYTLRDFSYGYKLSFDVILKRAQLHVSVASAPKQYTATDTLTLYNNNNNTYA
jgi:hypothetical protein